MIFFIVIGHKYLAKKEKKIFLDELFELNYETRWMLKSLELHRQKKLKSGCLFLSPIKHNRVFDYDQSTRKEKHLN